MVSCRAQREGINEVHRHMHARLSLSLFHQYLVQLIVTLFHQKSEEDETNKKGTKVVEENTGNVCSICETQ